ncbi:MAG: hypothetical protein JO290_06680 [Sphingomonadaceae bacterium]|nr:hypothetical protein [Sphingomonadaceae bacterium]
MKLSAKAAIMEELRLLCQCGVGLEAIASPFCDAVRRLTGADAAALFWHDERGIVGFCHDRAPDELRELFIGRFEELFASPADDAMHDWLLNAPETIGACLNVPPRFFTSANFKMLIEPCGHHWPFDCRVVIDGATRATLFLYNPLDRPFDASYIALLCPVQGLMRRAIVRRNADARWQAEPAAGGTLITDASGRRIVAIAPAVQTLFARCQMRLIDKSIVGATVRAPAFVLALAQQLDRSEPACLHFGVLGGQVAATAEPMLPADGEARLIAVHVGFERSVEVGCVERLLALPLTPLQREIGLHAMLGGSRADCPAHFGISDEAFKKHLKSLYKATGTERWSDLCAGAAGAPAATRPLRRGSAA